MPMLFIIITFMFSLPLYERLLPPCFLLRISRARCCRHLLRAAMSQCYNASHMLVPFMPPPPRHDTLLPPLLIAPDY